MYEPFADGRYQHAQNDALRYLRAYYGAEVTTAAALAMRSATPGTEGNKVDRKQDVGP